MTDTAVAETPAKTRARKAVAPKEAETVITTPHVFQAIAAIQAEVGTIPKTGKMSFGATKYDYVTNDDILIKVRDLLIKNSVIVQPKLLAFESELRDIGANRSLPIVKVMLEQTYVSAIDGSTYGPIQVFGEGTGSDDKGLRKAVTSAQKIANLLTFSIATGEPDQDAYPGEAQAQPKSTAAKTGAPLSNDKVATASDPLAALRNQIKAAAASKGYGLEKITEIGLEIDQDFGLKEGPLKAVLEAINKLEPVA